MNTQNQNEVKLVEAMNYLGTNHVLHPEYKFRPRHTNTRDWVQHSILRQVADEARQAGRL